MKKDSGQAAILIIFVLGMVSLLIGVSLVGTGFGQSLMGRSDASSSKAFYAANAGVEEAFYQINKDPSYLAAVPVELAVGEAKVGVKVSGTDELKTIESTGTFEDYFRKLKVVVQSSSLKPGFLHAVQAGAGGFELENNTLITSDDLVVGGNVYSNASVWGAKSACGTSGSKITGSVWAVDAITKLPGGGDNGICVGKDAHASNLEYCYIGGTPYSLNPLSAGCSSPNAVVSEPAVTPITLPNMGTIALKNFVQKKKIFTGDCTIGSTPDCYSVVGGVATIGEIYITGNFVKPNATDLNISGPVYVEGDIDFGSNSAIGLDSSVNDGISQVVAAKGKITSANNISYTTRTDPGGQKMFLIFISDQEPPAGNICDNPAVSLESNSDTVLFYATKGCVSIKTTAGTSFHGAVLGEKVRVTANTTLVYDPDLATAIFGLTKTGGWQMISFKEE